MLTLPPDEQSSWPPRDPDTYRSEGPDKEFVLPASPWTYENGSVNPNLEPFNGHLRNAASTSKRRPQRADAGTSALPPYHPDYVEGADAPYEFSGDDSSEDDDIRRQPLVRRGSEGYEVRSVDREDMLQRYLRELGEEPGRYHRYIPYPDSESEGSDDDVALAQVIDKRQ